MKLKLFLTVLFWLIGSALFGQQMADVPYMNPDLSPESRAEDLVSRMTLEEEVLQMQRTAPEIPRLGMPTTGGTRRCTGPGDRLPAGHRTCRHVGYRSDVSRCRYHFDRGAGQV